MGLLHSGSPKDIELVRIETTELTCIINGTPFHEQYESLKEYQKMDFHDAMQFSVEGKHIQDVKVFNVSQEELTEPNDVRPIFFENGTYHLMIVPKRDINLTFYHEHPQFRESIIPVTINDQTILTGNLRFRNEVGLTYFEVQSENEMNLGVTLEIFPVKLDYKNDYQKLLQEVNDEIYNLSYHFIRKTFSQARLNLEGEPTRAEFYRLISEHFQQFLQSIQRIKNQPHHYLENSYKQVRGDQLRRQDSFTRSYLRKNPQVFKQVKKGLSINNRQMMPTKGLNIQKKLTYDTTENRYIKWMILRLIDKVSDLIQRISTINQRFKEKQDSMLMDQLHLMKRSLERELNLNFWKGIGELKQSALSLVMQMAPGYKDAFHIYLTVSKGLLLQGGFYRMSVKDIAVLYEYWTFLKLGQILEAKYPMISQDIVRVNRDGLFVHLEANKSAERVFVHPVTQEKIILTYQHYERGLPTTNQIPDTALKIEKKGKDFTYNYIFDAKYRVDYAQKGSSYANRYTNPGPVEEDINTMHRYRDAIVAAKNASYERTAFGAYVLFPWFDEHLYKQHHFYNSIDEVNIGGLPFLPNATSLVEQFVERLVNTSPEEIYQEGILPKGTKEEWRSNLDEEVLVGLVQTTNEYKRYIQDRYYHIAKRNLKSNWQHAKYVALYLKQGVHKDNGVNVYGEIYDVKVQADGVRFKINYWINLKNVIKPVNYGIANYMLTTINDLKEAKELPELYMKTNNEKIIWRMLRRVSDQIKVDLNSNILDQATEVNQYRIKDISIQLKKESKEIVLSYRDERQTLPLNSLDREPTDVFKRIVQLLESK